MPLYDFTHSHSIVFTAQCLLCIAPTVLLVTRCLFSCPSVRLSVCVCHTPVFCHNGSTYHQTFRPSGSHTTFVSAIPNVVAILRRGPPSECVECKRFSINISTYLRNDTRYGHSYYGMRIGNLTQTFQ